MGGMWRAWWGRWERQGHREVSLGGSTDPSVLPVRCGAPRTGERRKGAPGVLVLDADAYIKRCPNTEVQFRIGTQRRQSYGLDWCELTHVQAIK